MKILVSQKIAGISGSEKYYFKLFKGMKSKNVELTFLAIIREQDKNNAKKFTDEIENLGFVCDKIFIKKDYSLKIFFKLKKYLDIHQFDIVHSNLIHADFWFGITKHFLKRRIKLISDKHGYTEKYFTKYGITSGKIPYDAFWFIDKLSSNFIDFFIAKSNGIKDLYLNLKLAKAQKIETVHHGFDLNPVDYKKVDSKKLLILGRLSYCKGVEEALYAFKIVLEKHENYKLQIVGSGPLKVELIALSKKLKIEKNVEFVGFVNNVNDYIKNAEVMIVPTKGEGFGLVFLEAIENKIPIVAFDVPAGNEILTNAKTGFLVEPFNVETYAKKIIELIENEPLRKSFAEDAFKDAQKRFALDKMIDSTLQVYKKMLNK